MTKLPFAVLISSVLVGFACDEFTCADYATCEQPSSDVPDASQDRLVDAGWNHESGGMHSSASGSNAVTEEATSTSHVEAGAQDANTKRSYDSSATTGVGDEGNDAAVSLPAAMEAGVSSTSGAEPTLSSFRDAGEDVSSDGTSSSSTSGVTIRPSRDAGFDDSALVSTDGGSSTGNSSAQESESTTQTAATTAPSGEEGTSSADTTTEARACTSSPEAPSNGGYPNCAGSSHGESCLLVCNTDYLATGNAECNDGIWSAPTCERLGTLTVTVKEPVSADSVPNALVYVWGRFDPGVEACDDSPFCATSDEEGTAFISAITSGDEYVVISSEGFEELLIPVHTEPNEDAFATLPVLPNDYAGDAYALLLSWPARGADLDLIVQVPGPETLCLHYRTDGSLTEDPFSTHEGDVKGQLNALGPEAVRLALNAAGTGPYYTGSYRVIVAAPNQDHLSDVEPEIRLVLPKAFGADALDRVILDRFPDISAEANIWHAFNLNSDGSISEVNTTEVTGDPSEATLPCIADVYGNAAE